MLEMLKQFSNLNPEAKISVSDDCIDIKELWGDNTVSFKIDKDDSVIINDLNNTRFPKRFSAIWHNDTADIEFIYGPVPINDHTSDRKFKFYYKKKEYQCEFCEASERLIRFGKAYNPSGPPSDTSYRNLPSIKFIERIGKYYDEKNIEYVLTSFFVRNVKLNEDDLPDFAKHINFYMSYFDRQTPYILFHDEKFDEIEDAQITRYLFDDFPNKIIAKELDPYLLILWENSHLIKDSFRKIIANYQILEYAAFYYLRSEIKKSIFGIIEAPDILSRTDKVAQQLMDIIVEDRMSDEAKINAVINQVVDPEYIWKVIKSHSEFFSSEIEFEGGLIQPPLINKDWTIEDFKTSWIPKLPDQIRRIRNGLVHAREQRLSKCIAPTKRNMQLLGPWANLMSSISYQILLSKI